MQPNGVPHGRAHVQDNILQGSVVATDSSTDDRNSVSSRPRVAVDVLRVRPGPKVPFFPQGLAGPQGPAGERQRRRASAAGATGPRG